VIQAILFLVLGAGLLVLLYLFAGRKDPRPEGGAEALVQARQALNSLQTGLLPPELIVRIFAREDLEFVNSVSSPGVQKLFLSERKRVALRWVAHVRKQVLSLKDFHSGQSRIYARLEARTEIALAFDFAGLLVACRILQIVFYLRGPYAAPKIVQRAVGVAGSVCAVSQGSLAFLGPVKAGPLRRDSAGNGAAI
jgi:hypothetical protein